MNRTSIFIHDYPLAKRGICDIPRIMPELPDLVYIEDTLRPLMLNRAACLPDVIRPIRGRLIRGLKFFGETEIVGTEMKKGECKGDHQGHLCVLASNDQIERIKELTQHPRYICFNCGRVADCEDNLCNPMSLTD